ncbi:unnamed protein product [Didymodactylos carnosus]|uniref:Alpha/beta hydrolase fold-3 domain-containing protein n=1 Tax=Didymodactylos carnosus TaxID=1234261 RepID=A0A814DU84_9BILA|nr:unnamed protein product [Didymodactylos carnosus]CAF1598789.1 unnamed protein product [Didymodactylos carnosus]CAF3735063.1 unnamed protein product [Didymodactylos carnosus]CAF4406418.1 unnamed protein product [Didymodactylos carnosus]
MSNLTGVDYDYSPSRWSNRSKDANEIIVWHTQTLKKETDLARTELRCILNIPVSDFNDHFIDIYLPKTCDPLNLENSFAKRAVKPVVFVYIHGGYWQYLSRAESAFMARSFCNENYIVISVGYPLAPQARMDQIIACVETSFSLILNWAKQHLFRVYVCGHSAGAHLAAILLSINWLEKYSIPKDTFGGFFLISGVYDLQPLVDTYINEPLRMTNEQAKSFSPMLYDSIFWSDLKYVPILCICGEYDPPSFHEQNKKFGAKLRNLGFHNAEIETLSNDDHFTVIEQLQTKKSVLTSKIMDLIEQCLLDDSKIKS